MRGGLQLTTLHSGISMALESPVSVAAITPASLPISATTVTPVVPLLLPPAPLLLPPAPLLLPPKTKTPTKKRGRKRKPAQAAVVATNQATAQVLIAQEAPSGPTNVEVDLSCSEPECGSSGEEEPVEVINDGELKWEKVELSKWVPPAGCARWDIAEGKEGHVGRDGKPNNVGARRYVHTPGGGIGGGSGW